MTCWVVARPLQAGPSAKGVYFTLPWLPIFWHPRLRPVLESSFLLAWNTGTQTSTGPVQRFLLSTNLRHQEGGGLLRSAPQGLVTSNLLCQGPLPGDPLSLSSKKLA